MKPAPPVMRMWAPSRGAAAGEAVAGEVMVPRMICHSRAVNPPERCGGAAWLSRARRGAIVHAPCRPCATGPAAMCCVGRSRCRRCSCRVARAALGDPDKLAIAAVEYDGGNWQPRPSALRRVLWEID